MYQKQPQMLSNDHQQSADPLNNINKDQRVPDQPTLQNNYSQKVMSPFRANRLSLQDQTLKDLSQKKINIGQKTLTTENIETNQNKNLNIAEEKNQLKISPKKTSFKPVNPNQFQWLTHYNITISSIIRIHSTITSLITKNSLTFNKVIIYCSDQKSSRQIFNELPSNLTPIIITNKNTTQQKLQKYFNFILQQNHILITNLQPQILFLDHCLDIQNVNLIINQIIPKTSSIYQQRIKRSSLLISGCKGTVINFVPYFCKFYIKQLQTDCNIKFIQFKINSQQIQKRQKLQQMKKRLQLISTKSESTQELSQKKALRPRKYAIQSYKSNENPLIQVPQQNPQKISSNKQISNQLQRQPQLFSNRPLIPLSKSKESLSPNISPNKPISNPFQRQPQLFSNRPLTPLSKSKESLSPNILPVSKTKCLIQSSRLQTKCSICLLYVPTHCIPKCGHLCVCQQCIQNQNFCPICRTRGTFVRIYV